MKITLIITIYIVIIRTNGSQLPYSNYCVFINPSVQTSRMLVVSKQHLFICLLLSRIKQIENMLAVLYSIAINHFTNRQFTNVSTETIAIVIIDSKHANNYDDQIFVVMR